MKLTLDQLRVDSYSTQLSESELTEVKGGTTPGCVEVAVAAIAAVATVIVASIQHDDPHTKCTNVVRTVKHKDGSTTTTTSHVCKE